jgi:predicted LPLAT superfamily acyltransferase
MSAFRACVIIPTHNHVSAMDATLSFLGARGLPAIVIDDASDEAAGASLREICARHPDAEYQRHAFNGGKGFAVMCGISRANERGFTHAVQIDADGQHDLSCVDPLLAAARLNPDAIVTGVPVYDHSIPSLRRFWRPFTNFWVRVNTLSSHIRDAMCGFRVYPVAETLELVRKSVRSRRMDFDVEILVKAYWARIAIASVPVRVRYPEGNFSNFDLLRDNVLLSRLQAKLFFGMLLRAPSLVFRRAPTLRRAEPQPTPWAKMKERGVYWGLRFLAGVYRVLGRPICLATMSPVVFYFFLTGREQREASRDYLTHLWNSGHLDRPPTRWMSFRHFMNFGASALDKLAAWTGDIPRTQLQGVASGLLNDVEVSGRGAFVITAHLGNPEVIRAVAVLGGHVPVNVLMHTEHAQLFNRLIREFSPNSPVRAFPVTKVGVDTAIILSQAIEKGEWVVIVGDRAPVTQDGRVVEVPFLGELAAFPQGPYILGALLKAPAYLLFCVRGKQGFDVHFSKFADPIELPRSDRVGAIRRYAGLYAKELEARVAETPLQWFNFYSFWRTAREPRQGASAMRGAAE